MNVHIMMSRLFSTIPNFSVIVEPPTCEVAGFNDDAVAEILLCNRRDVGQRRMDIKLNRFSIIIHNVRPVCNHATMRTPTMHATCRYNSTSVVRPCVDSDHWNVRWQSLNGGELITVGPCAITELAVFIQTATHDRTVQQDQARVVIPTGNSRN